MTAETIHTCSYYCERLGCIKRQRDELRDRLEAALAQQPAAPSGAVNVVGMPEFDGLLDHIYEHGTAADGVIERANALARAVLARYAPQRYDIDADPNGIRADVTRCVRAAMYCGANNVNPPPEGHWLRDFWLIGLAEASRQDDLAAQHQEPTT